MITNQNLRKLGSYPQNFGQNGFIKWTPGGPQHPKPRHDPQHSTWTQRWTDHAPRLARQKVKFVCKKEWIARSNPVGGSFLISIYVFMYVCIGAHSSKRCLERMGCEIKYKCGLYISSFTRILLWFLKISLWLEKYFYDWKNISMIGKIFLWLKKYFYD
jgi:hypothetical protein